MGDPAGAGEGVAATKLPPAKAAGTALGEGAATIGLAGATSARAEPDERPVRRA